MRASRILLNAARKGLEPKVDIPVEMYPLFAAVGVAIGSLGFFTYRHFAYDQQLRLWKNPNLSNLDKVLNEDLEKQKKADQQ